MSDLTLIFQSVFLRLTESFIPQINQNLKILEKESNQDPSMDRIKEIFDSFPRNLMQYNNAIQTLTKVSKFGSSQIVSFLTDTLKTIFKSKNCSIFLNIQRNSKAFKNDCILHGKFMMHFEIIFIVDLISQIISSYGTESLDSTIIDCSKYFVEANEMEYHTFNKILKQWAMILSIVSETTFASIFLFFQRYIESQYIENVFKIMQYIRLDLNDNFSKDFFDFLLNGLKMLQKKKALNNKILKCVSNIITSELSNEGGLQSLFDYAFTLIKDKNLKNGAFVLISSLFPKIKKKNQNQYTEFYKKRVYKHTGNDQKVKRSLKMFQRLMFGTEIDIKWYYWSWGEMCNISPLVFIHWNSERNKHMKEQDSFAGLFMHHFFQKSNFAVCPYLFRDVIIHLASLDFSYFISDILPSFLTLPFDDPRILTLLMTVPIINSDDFSLNSYNEIKYNDKIKFNETLRPIILNNINRLIEIITDEHGICIENENSWIQDANQKVSSILDNWKLSCFTILKKTLVKSLRIKNDLNLQIQMLNCFNSVLNDDDFLAPTIMNLILKLSFHRNFYIASFALSLCHQFSEKNMYTMQFLEVVMSYLNQFSSDESQYVCISFLLGIVTRKSIILNENILHNIEVHGMIGLISTSPEIRFISMKLLRVINQLLKNNGAFSYIDLQISNIENLVKQRLLLCKETQIPLIKIHIPVNQIPFQSASYSSYYDIWLYFISEIMNILISVNYTPLIKKFSDNLSLKQFNTCKPENIGLLIYYLSSSTNSKLIPRIPKLQPFEDFNIIDQTPHCVKILKKLLCSSNEWEINLYFSVLKHLNISCYQAIFNELFSTNQSDQLKDAARELINMIRSPKMTSELLNLIRPNIVSFLSFLQNYFIKIKINGPRVIKWTPESEKTLLIAHSQLICEYCHIICLIFQNYHENEEENWSYSSREITFRFLVNWGMTKLPELETMRTYVSKTLSVIVKVGTIFNDSLLFNDDVVEYFASIELSGIKVLKSLLLSHIDLLLDIYANACLTLPTELSDLFFDSLINVLDYKNINHIYKLSGILILVGLVLKQSEHIRADSYLKKLINVLYEYRKEENPEYELSALPRKFDFCAEAVIHNALLYIRKLSKKSVKTIVEAIRPWIQSLRLLPKQISCVPHSSSIFKYFTPYSFLVALMKTTEMVRSDDFRYVASLWTDLIHVPDHKELIPLFISKWEQQETKKKMFLYLIETNCTDIFNMLASNCSFAYYFHITSCLSQQFENEMWIVPLLTVIFKKNKTDMYQYITSVIHFSFLFVDFGAGSLLEMLCQYFEIDIPGGSLNSEIISSLVQQFVIKIQDDNLLEMWGTEALRWLLGSKNIKFTYLSLLIYHKILKPFEKIIIPGVCKAVLYHIQHSEPTSKYFYELIGESFSFYSTVFQGNELYAYNYAAAFLDCNVFVQTCLSKAIPLFIKCFESPSVSRQAWNNIIGIVRPMIKDLESNEVSQKIFDLLIEKSGNKELMMIVAPIKEIHPNLFPSSELLYHLINNVSETTLCQTLIHYSSMVDSASIRLLNEIFRVLSMFTNSVANENNRTPLIKLYKTALNHLNNCEYSIDFITSLSHYIPTIASKSVYEFYFWNRSIEDVTNILLKLVVKQDSVDAISDCKTIISVYNLLGAETTPKILPFVAQDEMIEGMKIVRTAVAAKRLMSIRRYSHGLNSFPNSTPIPQISDNNMLTFEPFHESFEIKGSENKFEVPETSFVIKDNEFLDLLAGPLLSSNSSCFDLSKGIINTNSTDIFTQLDSRFQYISPMLKWIDESKTRTSYFTYNEVSEVLSKFHLDNEFGFIKQKILPKLGTKINEVPKSLLAILYSFDSLKENSSLLEVHAVDNDIFFKVNRVYSNMVQEEKYKIINYTDPIHSQLYPVVY